MVEQAQTVEQAQVRPAADPSLAEVRGSVECLVAALSAHLDTLSALPAGPTSYVVLSDIHEPVLLAVARWDRAVYDHTGTLPVAVDDEWSEDLVD